MIGGRHQRNIYLGLAKNCLDNTIHVGKVSSSLPLALVKSMIVCVFIYLIDLYGYSTHRWWLWAAYSIKNKQYKNLSPHMVITNTIIQATWSAQNQPGFLSPFDRTMFSGPSRKVTRGPILFLREWCTKGKEHYREGLSCKSHQVYFNWWDSQLTLISHSGEPVRYNWGEAVFQIPRPQAMQGFKSDN